MSSYDDLNTGYRSVSDDADDGAWPQASGRASVNASSLSASVPASSGARATATVGSASVGAPVGTARVGGSGQRARATASVGAPGRPPGAAARATARVPGAGPAPDDDLGAARAAARAAVRARYADGSMTGTIARFIDGTSDDPKARRRRRFNVLIAALSVLGVLLGAGVVGFTYYSTTVFLPGDINKFKLTSTLVYADGRSEIGKVGEENRTYTPIRQIPPHVWQAVASAEDRKFLDHSGVDYLGIMRAAWNNFTGGAKQGASTITQQYARNAMDGLSEISYNRKVREAILASKLNDKFSKEQIMEYYLNTIYFGRGANSIETAARAYYNKSVSRLNPAEAAVLAAVIKQPEPSEGHKGYDPSVNPAAAQERWRYVLDGMREKNWLTPEQYQAAVAKYPMPRKRGKADACVECTLQNPAGIVRPYIAQELAQMRDPATGKPICEVGGCNKALREGGYRITTTLNPRMQEAAVRAASEGGDILRNQPKNLRAALVSIDPATGGVLAYYGGMNKNPADTDYANVNEAADGTLYGGHAPGSSAKIYTLAAALAEGYTTESRWRAKPRRVNGGKLLLTNSDRDSADQGLICGDSCTLRLSTVESYNVPFYGVAERIGAGKIVEMAAKAGVNHMWTSEDGKVIPIGSMRPEEYKDRTVFDNVVAYGQYPMTVLDHANGLATFANRGVYNKAHFIAKVERKDLSTGKFKLVGGWRAKPEQRIDQAVADDVTDVLKGVPRRDNKTLVNHESAGKTGTWEFGGGSKGNRDAWMVGYTRQVATAVWVGSDERKRSPIRNAFGQHIFGSMAPADIWRSYMNRAHEGLESEPLPPAANTGDPSKPGDGITPRPRPCVLPFLCDDDGQPGVGNGNGNGNGRPDRDDDGFPFPDGDTGLPGGDTRPLPDGRPTLPGQVGGGVGIPTDPGTAAGA